MTAKEMIEKLEVSGFKNPLDLVHVFQGGSYQHGASNPNGGSDIDLYGVYVEPPKQALGITTETHYTQGTQDQHERNRPGDEDYKCYTLRRWAGLAANGNPTILGFLFTHCELPGVWATHIVPNIDLFKARFHANSFLGYAKGQSNRLFGNSGKGKHGQRPCLEEAFGYDTKAAMHLMRLLFEAEEYVGSGTITYPRPEKDILLEIRTGKWSYDKLMKEYYEGEKRVEAARESSKLPDRVDSDKISRLIADAYIQHWSDNILI